MQKKASRMNRLDAKTADQQERTQAETENQLQEEKELCMTQYVQSVEKRLKSRSSPQTSDRFIAKSALTQKDSNF